MILSLDDDNNYKIAAKIIKRGGLVAFPTETVYGLGASALDPEAVLKIFEAKGRPQDNPLIVHVSSLEMARGLVRSGFDRLKKLADAFWPGPLTVVVHRTDLIPGVVSAGLDTVAIRFPESEEARKFIDECGVPIAAPSANLSGNPSPTVARHVIADLTGRVDCILCGHDCNVGVESTVISVTQDIPRLLRPGFVTYENLLSVLPDTVIDRGVREKIAPGQRAESPGMKYKHYSPKADVILLRGSFEKYVDFISANKHDGVFALCYNGEGEKTGVPYVEYGDENDSSTQAKRLFSALRELDEKGAVTVYGRYPSDTGVGLAVYNRLIKAAGYKVIDL